jgi:hypothetical protein
MQNHHIFDYLFQVTVPVAEAKEGGELNLIVPDVPTKETKDVKQTEDTPEQPLTVVKPKEKVCTRF